ncbi:MAG: 23S rRNA pseudouridine(2604) synthase RluF [Bacteroidales bacterium]
MHIKISGYIPLAYKFMNIRLNKVISDSGLCSRREADKYIEQGRVTVNGKPAEMGTKIGANDVVRVDGHIIKHENDAVYIVLNKPAGITCTTDQSEAENIIDFVNYPSRIFNIGRLDKPSEGLILLTNDGNIVNKILRASNNHEKEYEVMVNKPITEDFATKMATGVPILGTMTKKCKFEKEGENRFRITLTQGLNRQIRRMCEALGYEVVKLKRVRVMNITLNKLPLGQWRFLTDKEVEELMELIKDSENTTKPAKETKSAKTENKTAHKLKRSSRPSKSLESRSASKKSTAAKPSGKREGKSVAKPVASSARFTAKGPKSGGAASSGPKDSKNRSSKGSRGSARTSKRRG